MQKRKRLNTFFDDIYKVWEYIYKFPYYIYKKWWYIYKVLILSTKIGTPKKEASPPPVDQPLQNSYKPCAAVINASL